MNQPLIAGGILVVFAAWALWPQVGSVLKKVGGALPGISPDPADEAARRDDEDFRAFRALVARAERRKNPEASKYLDAALPALFGGSDHNDL